MSNFENLMTRNSITVPMMAEKTSLSRQQIYSLMHGRVNPNMMRYGSLVGLCDVFGFEVSRMQELVDLINEDHFQMYILDELDLNPDNQIARNVSQVIDNIML